MSTVKTNNVQIGQSVTATNNFTWYQPATPDGTVRLGNGNSGSVTDLVTLTSAGNLGIGTSSPSSFSGYHYLSIDGTTGSVLNLRSNGTSQFEINTTTSDNNISGLTALPLVFKTNGSERMRLDSSGNLGLGVTPSAWTTWKPIQVGTLAALSGSSTAAFVSNNFYYDGNGRYISTAAATLYEQSSGIHKWYTAPSGTAGNAISFTQAMTLDASGNLGIGTTSPATDSVTLNSKLLFIFYIQSTYPNIAARIGHAGDSGGVTFTNFNNSSDRGFTWFNGTTIGGAVTQVMRLDNSGNLTISGATATKASGTTWANPSDTRLKDNQQLYTKGLDDLLKIVVKTWEFNGKGGSTKGAKGLGVIADEIERVLPESVDTYSAKLNDDDDNETEIKRFDASEVIWLLVNSVKELSAELNELKQKVNA